MSDNLDTRKLRMDKRMEMVVRAICQETCAFRGEPPCWSISDDFPPETCDEPGCEALARAAITADDAAGYVLVSKAVAIEARKTPPERGE